MSSRLAAALALLCSATALAEPAKTELVLWHSYSGAEQHALDETVKRFNALPARAADGIHLTTLPIPADPYPDKLTSAIGVGKGPDLFIFAHDRLGDWAAQGLVEPVQYWLTDEVRARFPRNAVDALTIPVGSRSVYGLPLATKSVALVYDSSVVAEPPRTLDDLARLAKELKQGERYGFVFDWGSTYMDAAFVHAFGGALLDGAGKPTLNATGNVQGLSFVRGLRDQGLLPREVSGAMVGSLFNDHKAAMVVTGPWAIKDISKQVPFKVAPLPAGPNGPARPYLSVEALLISSASQHKAEAYTALAYLTSDEAAKVRLEQAQQPVANTGAWAEVQDDALQGFRAQAELATPMPSAPAMRQVWAPMDAALARGVGQGVDLQAALDEAQRRIVASVGASEVHVDAPPQLEELKAKLTAGEGALVRLDGARWAGDGDLARVEKPVADLLDRALAANGVAFHVVAEDGAPKLYAAVPDQGGARFVSMPLPARGPSKLLFAGAGLLALLAALAFVYRRQLAPHFGAYAYVAPAVASVVVLIFVPFGYGLSLGFYDVSPTHERFVGLKNFADIVFLRGAGDAHSFYFTFGMTVLWTVVNVSCHLVLGLFLALLLQDPLLRMRKVYRVLLIIPWAIPNYITALIWKAMFNAEYGLINRVFGLGTFSWFERPTTSFVANLVTNIWLGFPFMMVTALGALQSIPRELYEAADIDGASRWDKFTNVTLPLLKPALFPAVILGTIWTFNLSFNVIYLVSGGAPDGATDILVTQAFRYAFEQYRYGYAAAYATLIFFILLAYTVMTNRITRATEGAFE